MDCDWTPSTRDAYSKLLKALRPSYPELTATIRLHQVKYFNRTGVPPVKRGVLMYYNMSNVRDVNTKNYVLDLEVARKYHVNFDRYPLPLDLALPIYSQARVIRQGKVVMLLKSDGLNHAHLQSVGSKSNSTFSVRKGHYADGRFLYEGDTLKIDRVSVDDLQAAAEGLRSLMTPTEIIFYEQGYASNYSPKTLKAIARVFE